MSKELQIRELFTYKPFSTLPANFIDFCLVHGRTRHYAPKQYLYFAGDEGNTVYFLLSGRIRLYLMGEFTEKIIRVLSPQTSFPK